MLQQWDCAARHHRRTGKDPWMTQSSSGNSKGAHEIYHKKTTLAWGRLKCFGSSHPHELMIFREGITLIPYSHLLPPMDIWHIGRRRPFYLSGEL